MVKLCKIFTQFMIAIFFHENSKFKDNSDNVGARIMNLATYDVGDDKKPL
jgi:hypothetical protein